MAVAVVQHVVQPGVQFRFYVLLVISVKFSTHEPSILSAEIGGSTGIPPEVEIRFPEPHESPENPPPGYCCAFEIFFSACGLSFLLPELIVKMMFELGFALPQMCPNFVQTVLCLQTLGEEFDYQLSLADFLQVYTVKTGRAKGTLYVSPLSGLKVFDDLPEKDEKWRKSYFFFPVNELTFGHRASSYVSKWTSKIDHFERGLLCPTFAEFFSRFCSQGQIAWDSFSCERIRASTARLGRRSLVCSDPVSVSEMNYREERACRIAEKEAKKHMAAALAEGKARIPIKTPSSSSVPEVSGTSAPPTRSSELAPKKTSAEVSSQQTDSSKKRKEPETASSSREKGLARTGPSGDERSRSSSKDRGPSSERRSKEAPPPKDSGDSSGRNLPKEQRPFARVPLHPQPT
ncbi:PREDICTED: uncharacterized protein At3g60930, chloroplastic-like [Camelina sativa]|uniref:Uncharacterized protein At3g60930, chloroplastic-like n=1 Tax=Camelina sativa TaxID=90675 RepID=A0ABM1QQT7_CAMSA|nr:PREDICTED: uncharacterized protein At3g60930, chloroplastic-like [Camelina sativa]